MRTWIAIVAGAVVGLNAVAAPIPKDEKAKTVEEKIVGTWKLVKSDAPLTDGVTFEITYKKGGEMEFTRTFEDKDTPKQVTKGKFKTSEPDDKNKLGTIDWTVKEGDEDRGELSKILELTDDKIVLEDPEGLKETFERVKPKKPMKKED